MTISIIFHTMAECLKYRYTSYVSKKHKKSHGQSTQVKMKNNTNNTMTGCIRTEPHQMYITKNRPTIKVILIKTNKRTD